MQRDCDRRNFKPRHALSSFLFGDLKSGHRLDRDKGGSGDKRHGVWAPFWRDYFRLRSDLGPGFHQ
jgi:hypothetical protein